MGFLRYVQRRLRSRTCVLLFVAGLVVMMIRSMDSDGNDVSNDVSKLEEEVKDEVQKREAPVNVLPEDKSVMSEKNAIIQSLLSAYDIPCDPSTLPLKQAWKLAESWTTSRSVHPDHAPEISCILRHMATAKILKADVGYKGTQNKLTLLLEGGQKVAFKPKWYPRDYIVEGEPYAGRDRHNAEIVGFFLNRLLGFNRVPLAVGRVVSLKRDIIPVATQRLAETFFTEGNNTCFLGKCLYCTGKDEAACGEGDVMEGTLVLWLADSWKFKKWRSPWQRSYREGVLMKWETTDDYCDYVKLHEDYKTGPRLMDLLDAVVMDYLIGNADRHHYETFAGHNDSMLVMLDNAKSFGNPSQDETSILIPILQCCRIHERLYQRLKQLSGGVLSIALQKLTRHDPISPVLTPPHYKALDRRLKHVFAAIKACLVDNSPEEVFVNDVIYSRDVR